MALPCTDIPPHDEAWGTREEGKKDPLSGKLFAKTSTKERPVTVNG